MDRTCLLSIAPPVFELEFFSLGSGMCNSADFMLHATKPLPHVGRQLCDVCPRGSGSGGEYVFKKYGLIKLRSSGVFFSSEMDADLRRALEQPQVSVFGC